ncbi:SDR family NAD(P)-dependent oxidoreductase [Gluconacetobacter azotocaptans]|uniref:SDR family NAD(P)-dependent oxidoreductase n=1 Tax=Gluconacetobacter azotocaptans TaxID=142834 RepID=A0A7W4JQM6_9PROT|nr:SDR family NAD(P)-dependent oxidoreductase [Gluconacetobacter azotocaptans]GBQ30057.1 hypothetical protein AA13594_1584 [Gluconacetobacter azotocaptans DSM 13594]
MQRLNAKTCVVTGAARGIGRAIAARFHREGGIVIVTDLNETAGAATAAEIGCHFAKLDVREEADWFQMDEQPAWLTRDLVSAKAWLRHRRRGGRSVGMLTSSGAVRLVADGVPLAPRSNELESIGHWFLKPYSDFRSAGALETPMSEFGCQGLELDYVCLCWGGDLI